MRPGETHCTAGPQILTVKGNLEAATQSPAGPVPGLLQKGELLERPSPAWGVGQPGRDIM